MNDKLYRFYFLGVKEPVEVQAPSSAEARNILRRVMPQLGGKYQKSRRVIGETVTRLLEGVSSRIDEKGVKLIWVGLGKTKSGWQSEAEVEKEAEEYMKRKNTVFLKDNNGKAV